MTHTLVTKEIVQRLKAAETAYTEAKLRALGDDNGNHRGVEIARLGHTTLLSIQRRRNNPSVNRATGFVADDLAHLADILGWLRDRSDDFWFDVAPALVDDAALKALADAGLYASFFLNVVCTPPRQALDPASVGVVVQEIDLRERAHDFAQHTRPSSTSERNMVRAGFQIAYTKLLYAPRRPEEANER
jgi:hypothetical protein